MDVCLNWFGHCNYVSSKHACIFYDEVSVMIHILQIFSAYFVLLLLRNFFFIPSRAVDTRKHM